MPLLSTTAFTTRKLDKILDSPDSGLPSAVRFFKQAVTANIFGNREEFNSKPFTEDDFSREEINAIKAAIQVAREDGRNYIEYGDYPTSEPWYEDRDSISEEVEAMFDDPARSAMFTLGMARFDENGTVFDTYDFAVSPEDKISPKKLLGAIGSAIVSPNRRSLFNIIGNMSGLRAGTGRKIEIRTQQPKGLLEE